VLRGFQEVLGLADAGTVRPLERGGAGLLAEAAYQGPGAGAGLGGDVGQGEVAAEVVL
jgi:hypothetical protein